MQLYVQMFNGKIHEALIIDEIKHEALIIDEINKLASCVEVTNNKVAPKSLPKNNFGYLKLQGIHSVSNNVEKALYKNLSKASEKKYKKLIAEMSEVNYFK